MTYDPFSAQEATTYDPRRVFYASRDTKPPYDRVQLRMSYPTQFVHSITEFLYEDTTRTFNSVQQVLKNAEYHGFHHMLENGYDVSAVAKMARLIAQTEDVRGILAQQDQMAKDCKDLWWAAKTTKQREVATRHIRTSALECDDPELAQQLLDILK